MIYQLVLYLVAHTLTETDTETAHLSDGCNSLDFYFQSIWFFFFLFFFWKENCGGSFFFLLWIFVLFSFVWVLKRNVDFKWANRLESESAAFDPPEALHLFDFFFSPFLLFGCLYFLVPGSVFLFLGNDQSISVTSLRRKQCAPSDLSAALLCSEFHVWYWIRTQKKDTSANKCIRVYIHQSWLDLNSESLETSWWWSGMSAVSLGQWFIKPSDLATQHGEPQLSLDDLSAML